MTLDAHKLLAVLFAAYPVETRNIPADQALVTARLYARMLADLDEQVLTSALERLVRTSERLPTVARIRAVAVELIHGPRRSGVEAWGDVRRALSRRGRMTRPGVDWQWDDPLVGAAVDAMGWLALCDSENSVADRARFCEMYDNLAQQARTDAQAAPGGTVPQLRIGAPAPAGAVVQHLAGAHGSAQEGRS